MTERQRILLSSIAIMVLVSLSAAGIAIYVLYRAALDVHKARLEEVVLSRARLIEAVGRFDARYSQDDVPGGADVATLSQVVEAHEGFQGFGETGEFTLARRESDQIVWLLRHRHGDPEVPSPIPLTTDLAEPMRRALRGESGTVVGLDYRGAEVLAAYEFIAELGWGVVAKIDMREIRQPFVRAGGLVAGIALLVIAAGAGLTLRVTSPLIRRVEARTDELREARDRLRASTSEALLSEDRDRRNLAVDLHDGLSQALTLASMKLALLRRSREGQGLDQGVQEVEQLVSEARERSESVTFQLCPPVLHDVGLAGAARWLADDLKRRYGLHVAVDDDGQRWPLDEVTRISLFRSLRELLINVAKHAQTSQAHVRLWGEGRLMLLSVEDQGAGFDHESIPAGFGLFSIRERLNHLDGSMQIDSVPGAGTRIVVVAPMTAGAPEASTGAS
jgi:signal transduction histidine kinase